MKSIPDIIIEARKAAGLTQEEVAERASIRWNHITWLEGGSMKPTIRTLNKINDALGGVTELEERIYALEECDEHRRNIFDGNFD